MAAQMKFFKAFVTQRDELEATVNAFLATLNPKDTVTVDAQHDIEVGVEYIIVTVTWQ